MPWTSQIDSQICYGLIMNDEETTNSKKFGLVVPLFKSWTHIEALSLYVNTLVTELDNEVSLTLVVDGCDRSEIELRQHLGLFLCPLRVVVLSRNFGVGPALRAAMSQQNEPFTIAFGSDLQEPVNLMYLFARELQSGSLDFVFGQRENRDDPFLDRNFSRIFWWLNKKFVFPDCPPGGFDVFGCNQVARNALVDLVEHRTNITSQMLWLGFRRKFIPFHRQSRFDGKSTWSFRKKLGLFIDSFTSFTSAPLKAGIVLIFAAVLGFLLCDRYSIGDNSVFVVNISSLVLGLGLTWPYLVRDVDRFNGRPTYVIRSVEEFD